MADKSPDEEEPRGDKRWEPRDVPSTAIVFVPKCRLCRHLPVYAGDLCEPCWEAGKDELDNPHEETS